MQYASLNSRSLYTEVLSAHDGTLKQQTMTCEAGSASWHTNEHTVSVIINDITLQEEIQGETRKYY